MTSLKFTGGINLKRLISFITALILLVGSAVSAEAADSVEFEFGAVSALYIGDVDTDTVLQSSDLVALKKILLSVCEPINRKTADLNFDEKIDILDLVRLKKKLSGQVISSYFDKEAEALKTKIMSASDELPEISGDTYYVSAEGGILQLGTKTSPYSYEKFLNSVTLKEGDAVLFKRGDVFRGGKIKKSVSGIYYGAYGEGDKPEIYGSAQNYANAEWTNEGNGIYSLSGFSSDVGIIVFGDNENVGFKRASKDALTSDYDYYYSSESGVLYLCSSKAPSEYGNIEIGVNSEIIRFTENLSNITVENLSLKYTGGHAISIGNGSKGITVKNCEIAYIGGSYLNGNTRYGNGIEFWQGTTDALVESNWIYQIYDSGITHQGGGEYTCENITFRENLIENCGMGSIEYWMAYKNNGDGTYGKSVANNVSYTDNIMRFAGYGFGGEQRPDKVSAHIRSDVTCPNNITSFKITGNIFDQSSVELVTIGSTAGTYPEMSGNLYAASTQGKLGTFKDVTDCKFDMFAEHTVFNVLKDSTAKIYWY